MLAVNAVISQGACVLADYPSGAVRPPGRQPPSQEDSGDRMPDEFRDWLGDFVRGEARNNCSISAHSLVG